MALASLAAALPATAAVAQTRRGAVQTPDDSAAAWEQRSHDPAAGYAMGDAGFAGLPGLAGGGIAGDAPRGSFARRAMDEAREVQTRPRQRR